jgi:hypothetical protein
VALTIRDWTECWLRSKVDELSPKISLVLRNILTKAEVKLIIKKSQELL